MGKKVEFEHYGEWTKYSALIFLLLKEKLSDFEKSFLESIQKKIGSGLSQKQVVVLDNIISKYFPRLKM